VQVIRVGHLANRATTSIPTRNKGKNLPTSSTEKPSASSDGIPHSVPRVSFIILVGIALGVLFFFSCAGVLNFLIIPAVDATQEAARRTACQTNMRRIAVALLSYHDANGCFPPHYTVNAEGQPLHSWRTLILPFTEDGPEIYKRLDLQQPWDAPANAAFHSVDLPIFRCPSAQLPPGHTCYRAVIAKNGVFQEQQTIIRLSDILDGVAETLLFTEVAPSQSICWLEPNELTATEFIGSPPLSAHRAGCNCAMVDGTTKFLNAATDEVSKAELISIADDFQPSQPPQ
jgi:hypothetical protein